MKKRLSILFVLLICMLSGAQAQLTKTIELTEAGTLEAALGDDIANVTELIVKGPLNDNDFYTMREKMKTLQILDMSGVTGMIPEVEAHFIPYGSFNNKLSLRKVILPMIVETIESSFTNCSNLVEVDFSKCKSLVGIADDAFSKCLTLEEIIIDNSCYKTQDGVLFSADMTTLICYPNGKKDVSYTIPSTVVTIKSIDNRSLKKIIIPESVKSIEHDAFGSEIWAYNERSAIYMQSSTPIGMSESIGDIASVHVPKGAAEAYRNAAVWKEYPIIEEDADPISITLTTAGTLQSEIEKLNLKKEEITKLIVSGPMNNVDFNVFSLMKNLSSIDLTKAEIPNNILPSNSFENLLFLEKVQLPESIEGIGFFAFSGCTSLKSINVFQLVNLTAIEGSAFAGCSIWNTENIKFPKTLNVLGTYAFSSMSPSSITLKSKEKVTTMDGDPFPDTDKEACVLYVPKGMKAEYQADPIWGLFKQIQEFGLLVTITSNVNNQNFIIKGAGAYEQGESASLEAYMNDDRYGLSLFDGWYEDGKKISSELSYSFKVEDKDRTLKAHFTNFDFSGYCQTTSNDGKVKFSLPADAVNLAFDGWYEDNKLISKETELTLEASSADRRTIEARTVSTLAKLTITNTTPDYGNVLQSGSGEYEKGTKVQVKALPYAGYKFVGWYQNSKLLSEETTYELTLTAQETTIEARFAIDDKQEEVHTLVIGTEGSHAGGQVSVQGLAKVGEQITVTAIPDAGYAFEGWYLDGKLIETALMSSTFKVEESMKQLVAKFKALPFQLETDGGEEGWAEVLLYRDSKVYMTAKKVSGYTFLGWYLGDKLLSTSYDYTFDVSQLRASLPTLKAKYFHEIVANESISSEKAIQIYRKDARLVIQSAVPIAQVEIYSFAGTLLHSEGGFEQEAQINAPSGSFIIRLKTADDEYIVRKVR